LKDFVNEPRATKICPDCAETVLAGARKCRFCGYRFDEEPDAEPPAARAGAAGGPASPLESVLSMLRRTDAPLSTGAEILASWGIRLGDDEGDATLCHGVIGGKVGFVVVTATRFRFIPATSRTTPLPVLEEHRLTDLLRVHRGRHRLRRALFVEWRESRTVVQLDRSQLERLEQLLAPHALAP
jgi:hypothetical protein